MPLLKSGDPLFKDVPAKFESLWPSNEAMLDDKLRGLLGDNPSVLVRNAMTTTWEGLQIALKNKAVVIGDYLTTQLNHSAWIQKVGQAAGQVQGVFAIIDWRMINFRNSDPQAVLAAMGTSLVPKALAALTAVPLAGQLAAAYFNVGLRLADIATSWNGLDLPWAEYSQTTDNELTRDVVLGTYSSLPDQTNLFRPPWSPKQEWVLGQSFVPGEKKKIENRRGHVWAPLVGTTIDWGDGVGALPGTLRMFGQTQVSLPTRDSIPPALNRIGRAPAGVTPRDLPILPPLIVTNCGDYYPSAANTCGSLWSLIGANGSPDMYKVHVDTLIDEWKLAFESMEQSFIGWWNNPNALLQVAGGMSHAEVRHRLSAAMEPWVATRITPTSPWQLGVPWQVPSNWGLITPAIYNGGKPGDPAGRTPSLWIEQDLARDLRKDADGNLLYPGWPYRSTQPDADGNYGPLPEQHSCSKWKACSADLAATIGLENVVHPAAYLDPNGPPPKGFRKVPWPTPEMDAAAYASPYKVIVLPSLQRLKAQQVACLKRTIVCAYVRPIDLPGLPAYGAFKDVGGVPNPLRQLCLDVREALLKHPIRFTVNLADAEAIDPQFAERLKKSGVTGKIQDFSKALQLTLLPGAPPPPQNEPPQGGVAFERRGRRPRRRGRQDAAGGGGGGLALFGLGLAGAAGAAYAFGRRKKR